MFGGCLWPEQEMVWWPEPGLVHGGLRLGDALLFWGPNLRILCV